ncbi:MAG: polysaccharide biosynthesis tyrosine autokinase [Cyanobacteria bacterium P01_D01_bin.156]
MASKDNSIPEIEIDIHKYLQVLKRRWLILFTVFGLATSAAVGVGITQEEEYQAEAKLLFELSNQTSSLVGLEGASRELRALTNIDNPLDTQIEVFRSVPIAQEVIEKLGLTDDDGEPLTPEDLLKQLTVTGIPGTDVLRVTYAAPDPELAKTVVNSITEIYIQNDIQANRAAAVAAQEFLSAQLPESESAVGDAESALRRFKETNGIVNLEEESTNLVDSLFSLENNLIQLQSQFADRTAQVSQIQQKLNLNPQEAYTVGLINESPGVQDALEQLQTVQANLAVARTRYREEHPEVVSIRDQEAALQSLLQERIGITLGANQLTLPVDDLQAGQLEQELIADFIRLESEQSGFQQQVEQLATAISQQQSRARLIPVFERQQRELERRLAVAQTTYEALLQNLQQAQVLENQNTGNARVISPAILPKESIGPSLKLFLMAGCFGGVLLGVIAAFLADIMDSSVKTVKEGQELYEYPLLGVIPACKHFGVKDKKIPEIVVRDDTQPHTVRQAYQSLQANLKFSYVEKPVQTITVTSAVAGEGKSEVAANLAVTLADLGHSVLLVDADLRRPMQHQVWDLANMRGLSNFATGELSLQDVIVVKEPNFHILPAGVIPLDPLAILGSEYMTSLIQACEQTYNYVIIDTPPIIGLSDSLTIGHATDGILLVMRPGMADAESIRTTKAMLTQARQQVLGLVANGINVKGKTDHYFSQNQAYVPVTASQLADAPSSFNNSHAVNANHRV